jgi:hypothetical protein
MKGILSATKSIAEKYSVDLAVSNCEGSGIGNALVYTRLVEEFALSKGRPIKIFTGPLKPSVGTVIGEDPFAIWRNNPFIDEIIDGSTYGPKDLEIVVREEEESLVQLNHIIENLCWAYNLKPRELRSSIYLNEVEMKRAIHSLKHIKRPLVCLHPGGNTKSTKGSPWHKKNWNRLIEEFRDEFGFFQIGRTEFGDYDIGLDNPAKNLRDTWALIWASDFFIGFDSSPMHVATAFKKPVVSLFDMRRKYEAESSFSALHIPSVILRWAYPNNRNISIMENDQDDHSYLMVVDELRNFQKKLSYQI